MSTKPEVKTDPINETYAVYAKRHGRIKVGDFEDETAIIDVLQRKGIIPRETRADE